MMTGIKKPQKAVRKDFHRSPQVALSREGGRPLRRTSIMMMITRARPIMMPGRMPPMNMSPTDTPVMEA